MGDDALYDESVGPKPRKRRAGLRPVCEWDDPTWLRVAIDAAYMAERDRQAHELYQSGTHKRMSKQRSFKQ